MPVPPSAPLFRPIAAAALALGLALAMDTAPATAQDEVTVSHGVSNFGVLKYPADFARVDYANPDAPKGGEISLAMLGNFDSFNNYTRKGVPAALTSIMYESILSGTADDPYGQYCYLCTTMEYPESRDWVIFNLREDVTFWDGSPLTAEDIKFTFEMFLDQGIAEYVNVVSQYLSLIHI